MGRQCERLVKRRRRGVGTEGSQAAQRALSSDGGRAPKLHFFATRGVWGAPRVPPATGLDRGARCRKGELPVPGAPPAGQKPARRMPAALKRQRCTSTTGPRRAMPWRPNRVSRPVLEEQAALSRLPERARQRLGHRHRGHRRGVSTRRPRPLRHHRCTVVPGAGRSDAPAAGRAVQRRLAEYWQLHLAAEHQRVHASRYAGGALPVA